MLVPVLWLCHPVLEDGLRQCLHMVPPQMVCIVFTHHEKFVPGSILKRIVLSFPPLTSDLLHTRPQSSALLCAFLHQADGL